MKKLALRLDDLTVESFSTATADALPGTVHGNDWTVVGGCATDEYQSCDGSCPHLGSCNEATCNHNTCMDTCNASCGGTCYATCPNDMTCYGSAC